MIIPVVLFSGIILSGLEGRAYVRHWRKCYDCVYCRCLCLRVGDSALAEHDALQALTVASSRVLGIDTGRPLLAR